MHWFWFFSQMPVIWPLELSNQFIKNVIIISHMWETLLKYTIATTLEAMGLWKSKYWRRTRSYLYLYLRFGLQILRENLINIFKKFVSNKISEFNYKNSVWMNKEIISYLKKGKKFLRNTTIIPQIILKICWLLQQLHVLDLL